MALAVLFVAGAVRAQVPCIGDCGGDGTVSVDDLLVGVSALLGGGVPCVAWDLDRDGQVRVDDLIRGVRRALEGPCHAASTPTSTPTVPADPLLALIQPVWVDACTRMGWFDGESSVTSDGIGLYCMSGPGHDNRTTLRRYADAEQAAAEFAATSAGFSPAMLRDLPAAYEERPFYVPDLGGAYRTLVWQLGCWIGTVASFDDTSYRFAPDPFAFSEAILDVAGAVLVARCGTDPPTPTASPTPTPTRTPTPSPSPDALFALLLGPWDAACRPFGVGVMKYAQAAADGYHFICAPTAGHENLTELRRFADADAALQDYERASAGLPAFDLDGLPAAYEERPFYYSGSCSPGDCGKRRTLVWRLDCWVGAQRNAEVFRGKPRAGHAAIAERLPYAASTCRGPTPRSAQPRRRSSRCAPWSEPPRTWGGAASDRVLRWLLSLTGDGNQSYGARALRASCTIAVGRSSTSASRSA